MSDSRWIIARSATFGPESLYCLGPRVNGNRGEKRRKTEHCARIKATFSVFMEFGPGLSKLLSIVDEARWRFGLSSSVSGNKYRQTTPDNVR